MDYSTMDSLYSSFPSKSANREVRKLLARSYLQEMRIREALSVYLGVLRDAPDDTDVFITLANLYHLAGSASAAIWLYRLVLQIQPTNVLARRLVLEVDDSCETKWDEQNPMADSAIENLARHLELITSAETLAKVRAAADKNGKTPAEERGGENSENVQQLMPALIELNIREARATGQPELAEALQSLQRNLSRQIEDRWADDLLRDETLPGPI